MNNDANKIYTSHGKARLIGYRIRINGELSLAFIKDGKLIGYEPWDSLCAKMCTGPCAECIITSNDENSLSYQVELCNSALQHNS